MKIYEFTQDHYGRFELVNEFDSIEEAKNRTGCKNLIRCLFREIAQTAGHVFTLDNDERIVRAADGKVYLDYVESITVYSLEDTQKKDFANQQGVDINLPKLKVITGFENIKVFLDRIEGRNLPFKYYVALKPLEKKFDEKSGRVECWYKNVKIGVFDNIAEARKVTGAYSIWANVLGECKTTKGLVFKFEKTGGNEYLNS